MSSAKILLLFEKSEFGHNYEVITYSLQVTGFACHQKKKLVMGSYQSKEHLSLYLRV